MDRKKHHGGFITLLPGDMLCGKYLGELPSHDVDGWDQADQDGRMGQVADEQGDDCGQ